jgi:NDMA-dependent alcohol dehydrogenase
MKTRAAILQKQPGEWEVVEVDLDEPQRGEVLVRMVASGLCHSDDHIAKNDVPLPVLPMNGGHEGAGIVEAVGPDVRTLRVGDHVLTSFVPTCGICRWCATGMQHLCDRGGTMLTGAMLDGTYRMHFDGRDVAKTGALGTFAEWNVFDESSCVKVRDDLRLDALCLLSCGVPTGWGSAVHAAAVEPGDVVIVLGVGGLGASALIGARHAGASTVVAVDRVEAKRDISLKLGATDFFTTMGEATELARSLTNGQGADSAIITVGQIEGAQITECFSAIRKAGTVAVTAQGRFHTSSVDLNLFELSMYQKRIQGVLYGMGSPRREIARLSEMYAAGQLPLDDLITARYHLDEINDGYRDMNEGRNIRGILEFPAS